MLSACANLDSAATATSITSDPGTQFQAASTVAPVYRTIAADVVSAAKQIFPPISSTLQFPRDTDPVTEYFSQQFAAEGYGIQRVSADQGANLFSYNGREADIDGKTLISVETTIGVVQIGRDYTIPRTNTVSPASPFRLSGTRIPIDVADTTNSRFVVSNPEFTAVEYVASLDLEGQAPPVISLITDDLVSRVAASNAQSVSVQALNSNRMEVTNLFYADQSNFSSILDNFDRVERQVVVFGNDSMVLGNTNKALIEQFVKERFKDNDLVSLVGCSNGPTALEIGNEGLALGRAERVTQELLARGVARDRVLAEGCWAPVSVGDKFPSRGVVLELWRERS